MSPIVCQGLKSCLDPRLIEPCVLSHKLDPSKSSLSQSIPRPQRPNLLRQNEHKENSNKENNINSSTNNIGPIDGDPKCNNVELGCWSFIESPTQKSYNFKEVKETEKVYVHPLVKSSASILTTKSLEMCTESLGSETGSDIIESMEEFSSLSWRGENFRGIQRSKSQEFSKKLNHGGNFPPPLTSISESDGVQVRPYREGGRLIIKAVIVSSSSPYFKAERANGRLRLSLLKNNSTDSDTEVAEKKETEANEESDNESDGYRGEDMEGNGGGEVGFEEVPVPSRCKEGGGENKGMSTWGPLWVSTS